MRTKVVLAGLMASACLLAQPPGGPGGPGGRGRMGFGPGGPGGPGREMMRVVAGAPYSGVEVRTTQQVLANGNTIQRQEQTTISRDNSGRVRMESTHQRQDGQGTVTRVTISDPVAGVIHELDTTNKISYDRPAHFPNSGTSTTGTGRQQNPRTTQAEANVKRETLSAQTVNGVMATGSRVTHTIPAGAIGNAQAIDTVRETWMAEDLKVPVMVKVTDPRMGTTVTQLTNINRTEPDASLFQVPSDYTVKRGGPGGPPPRGPRNGGPGQRQ